MTRRAALRRRLDERYPAARLEPLAGDASTRSFTRIRPATGPSLVLMDYGRPFEGETDDVRLARVFLAAGLPVARVVEAWPEAGALVLEDLGDRTLESELATRDAAGPLPDALGAAVDLAARIAAEGTPALAGSERADGPALDAERFRFEMDFFVEHWVGGALGGDGGPAADALRDLAERAAAVTPSVLCHRDYHSRNLLLAPDDAPAMVDIQDARWGPLGYDLASLLRDAYVEISEGWVDAGVARFLAALPDGPDAQAFRRDLDLLAAQRMLKALGTFGYQSARLGRSGYLAGAPRTVERIRRTLPGVQGGAELLGALDAVGALALP